MSDETLRSCVLIPCSSTESWAVPQVCLAEIFTLQTSSRQPPENVEWRGRTVPVLDMGKDDDAAWQERSGAGLVAIFLGLEGEGCDYWGVAVRGDGLAVEKVSPEEVSDAPEEVMPHATAAFRLNEVLYQVPDLDGFQRKLAAGSELTWNETEAS